jgi:hypothetical protein
LAPQPLCCAIHLPDLFQTVRQRFPSLKIGLREGHQAELEHLLQREGNRILRSLSSRKNPVPASIPPPHRTAPRAPCRKEQQNHLRRPIMET